MDEKNPDPSLDEIDRIHDAEPQRAGAALQALVQRGVAAADLARCAWLVNHVIGELLGRWGEALPLQRRLAGPEAPPAALRHWAAAAELAGEPGEAAAAGAELARRSGATPAQAATTVRLAALQFRAAALGLPALATTILECLPIDAGPLGPLAAGALNNLVSALLDGSAPPVEDPLLRRALLEGSAAARLLWRTAGTWLNQERADYLVALCANRVGDWTAARAAAQAGLDTIAANGMEDVDRAFLLLALARARRGLGDAAGGAQARAEADLLAERFDEPGLRDWFDRQAGA